MSQPLSYTLSGFPLARDLNTRNNEFLDLTKKFTTNQIFESRKDLIGWAKDIGTECDSVIVITKSEYGKRHRLYLSCAWYSRREETVKEVDGKRTMRTCPFQLRGIYLHEGKWKVKVHCGRHNHLFENTLEGHSYAGRLRANEEKLVTTLNKSGMSVEHVRKAPDLNIISNNEFLDLTEKFTTDRIFETRKDLIDWAKDMAKECDSVIVISKSDSTTRHRLYLSCAQNSKREESIKEVNRKRARRTCPFQLRGIHIHEGKWKVTVHCGRHDHLVGNTLEDHLYVGRLKPNEENLLTTLTNNVMQAEHALKARDANKHYNLINQVEPISFGAYTTSFDEESETY